MSSSSINLSLNGSITTCTTTTPEYLKNNTFLKFLDFLLPILRLELNIVKDALIIFDLKVQSRKQYGDTLHLASGTIDEMLKFFPNKEDAMKPLLSKLSSFPFGADKRTVQFLDVLIILTLLTRGPLREKAKLLYSYFALAEPEGMLEYEHAGLINKVGSCLRKINAIRPMDISADDARYLADLARRNEEDGTYHRSLNFSNFYHWITNSSETSPAYQFIRLFNRLLHITRSLDAKADAIASIVHDVTCKPDKTIGVPKFNRSNLIIQEHIPRIIFCTCHSVSFVLPTAEAFLSNVYAFVEKVQIAPNPLYEYTHKGTTKKNEAAATNECCVKTYRVPSHQKVYTPAFPHERCSKRNRVYCPSFQVTVSNLIPSTEYYITLYTWQIRFPSIRVTTPNMPPLLTEENDNVSL